MIIFTAAGQAQSVRRFSTYSSSGSSSSSSLPNISENRTNDR